MDNVKRFFEIASRKKYRYHYKGIITTEDLWDLTPKQLNEIYSKLKADLKGIDEDSLLATKTPTGAILEDKIAIITYIVQVKLKEIEDKAKAEEKKKKKAKILGLIDKKQDESLENMSVEDLKAMLENGDY